MSFTPSTTSDTLFPITGYEAVCTPATPEVSDSAIKIGAASPINLAGLAREQAFNCSVAPITGLGRLPKSASVIAELPPLSRPVRPIITSTDYDEGLISLAVLVPDNGGTGITEYAASCTDGQNSASGASATPSITVSGLAIDTSYTCTVTASNGVGMSDASAATDPITPEAASSGLPAWLLYEATKRS